MFETLKGLFLSRNAVGLGTAVAMFVLLGTVAALWQNPFFVRMTPAGSWEVSLLVALAVLTGVYVAIRRPMCSNGIAASGGVFGFLGIACPLCNKLLLLAFGAEALLNYYEPSRIYLAGAGVAITGAAVVWQLRARSPAVRRVE